MSGAVPRIGLTGGIGSGKSAVAALLRERGAFVVDADQVAREVVEPGSPGLAAVVAHFGSGVLSADGSLDRAGLASRVFGNAAELAALNSITHPLIARRSAELLAAAPATALIVYDMPLLVENGLTDDFDAVVVVDAPDDVRLERLVASRGLDRADVLARMASQAPREERLKAADFVIDNSGALDRLSEEVDRLLAWLGVR